MPAISVIVPVYNVHRYLPRCLDSLINQTFTDFEIILVDDGSTDGSQKLCDTWAGDDMRVITIHQDNQGVAAARNLGMLHATGQWVLFVDGDDWVDPLFLETIANPEYKTKDIIFLGYSEVDSKGVATKVMGTQTIPLTQPDFAEFQLGILNRYNRGRFDFTKIHVTGPCGKAYKRSLLLESGAVFPVGISSGEDSVFNFGVFSHAKTGVYVPKPLYFYRQHSASATHRYNPKIVDNFIAVSSLFKKSLTQQHKGEVFWLAYSHKLTSFFQFCTTQYFCHCKNKKRYFVRRKEFMHLRNSPPFAEAFDTVELATLPLAKKTYIFLLKRRWFFLTNIVTRLAQLFNTL